MQSGAGDLTVPEENGDGEKRVRGKREMVMAGKQVNSLEAASL